jgi:hypothetical protein
VETTIAIAPRDVRVAYADRREGDPYTVTLTHKPTGKSVTAHGPTLEGVRAVAADMLQAALEGRTLPAQGLVH